MLIRNIKKILLLLLIVVVFSAFYLIFYNVLSYGRVFAHESASDNAVDYVYNLLPILILTLSNIFIVFKLWRNTVVEKSLPIKVIVDFIVSFFALYAINKLYIIVATAFGLNARVGWAGTILCNMLLLMGVEMVYYIKRSREALKREEMAKREALQYQYDALKAQINPHFLFNALNMQVSLISLDAERAIEYTSELSNVYRYILTIQNKALIPLNEELDFLNSYISILKARYSNNFNVDIRYECDISRKYIIPYTTQLLVENVTKHNIISPRHPMIISITISEDYLVVSNPITSKENTTSSGIGLLYIKQQLQGEGKEVAIENDGKTFTAKIPYLCKSDI